MPCGIDVNGANMAMITGSKRAFNRKRGPNQRNRSSKIGKIIMYILLAIILKPATKEGIRRGGLFFLDSVLLFINIPCRHNSTQNFTIEGFNEIESTN